MVTIPKDMQSRINIRQKNQVHLLTRLTTGIYL